MAELRPVLAEHTIIGLDTNPFIYLFERSPKYFLLVETLFDYLKTPGVQGVTSIVTLIETCLQPQREGRADLVQIYEQALLSSRQVQMLSINPALVKQAVQLQAKYDLRVPDALQVSAALEKGATLFVTNNSHMKKFMELSLLILDDYAS